MTTTPWTREPARIYRLDATPDGRRSLHSVAPDSIERRAIDLADARETQHRDAVRVGQIDAAATAIDLERDAREQRARAVAVTALDTPAPLSPLRVARGLWRVACAIPALVAAEVRRG